MILDCEEIDTGFDASRVSADSSAVTLLSCSLWWDEQLVIRDHSALLIRHFWATTIMGRNCIWSMHCQLIVNLLLRSVEFLIVDESVYPYTITNFLRSSKGPSNISTSSILTIIHRVNLKVIVYFIQRRRPIHRLLNTINLLFPILRHPHSR